MIVGAHGEHSIGGCIVLDPLTCFPIFGIIHRPVKIVVSMVVTKLVELT